MSQTNENKVKYREFWIKAVSTSDTTFRFECSTCFEAPNAFPVIEKRAYDDLRADCEKLVEAAKFGMDAAEYMYQPDKPLQDKLDPTFYHTLTYKGDLELIEQTKKYREALKEFNDKWGNR